MSDEVRGELVGSAPSIMVLRNHVAHPFPSLNLIKARSECMVLPIPTQPITVHDLKLVLLLFQLSYDWLTISSPLWLSLHSSFSTKNRVRK